MSDTIRRRVRRENFTTVNNDYLRDTNLSWKAKGLVTYVMSLPADWHINVSDLKNRSKDGRDATTSGINELIEQGYCKRTMARKNGGEFDGYIYEISDMKDFEDSENPKTENPFTENPKTENPSLLNTNNTNKTENNNIASQEDFAPDLFGEVGKDKKTLFRNSSVYSSVVTSQGEEWSALESIFAGPEFADVDIVYYFYAVADWSDSANKKKTRNGWIATMRNFIRGDIEKGKLHTKKKGSGLTGAISYLEL